MDIWQSEMPQTLSAFGFFFLLSAWPHQLSVVNGEMQCLVARPGFGLVSEHCPAHTVACRIRIEHEAVSFYEYSPLYDRNQFVCVHKGEFGEQHGSGCVRKRSGHVRCWCFGRSNCNTPENSKLLYNNFVNGDDAKFREAVEEVDFTDLADDWDQSEPGSPFTNGNGTTSTTTKSSTTKSSTASSKSAEDSKATEKATVTLAPAKQHQIMAKKTATEQIKVSRTEARGLLLGSSSAERENWGSFEEEESPSQNNSRVGKWEVNGATTMVPVPGKGTANGKQQQQPHHHNSHHHNQVGHNMQHKKHMQPTMLKSFSTAEEGSAEWQSQEESIEQEKKRKATSTPKATTKETTISTSAVDPPPTMAAASAIGSSQSPQSAGAGQSASAESILRSEYDRHNRVHIIHVSARDRYEPVNLFGSPALQRIMDQERRMLEKTTSESAAAEEAEEDEDDLELEELEEDWEEQQQQNSGQASHQTSAEQPRRVAARSQQSKQQQQPHHHNSHHHNQVGHNMQHKKHMQPTMLKSFSTAEEGSAEWQSQEESIEQEKKRKATSTPKATTKETTISTSAVDPPPTMAAASAIGSSQSPQSAGAGQSASAESILRSEYDRHNRVHIIHVSARDRYEPVNLFGSPALQRIMDQERRMLEKTTSESAAAEEAEEDEDDLELEELEEDEDDLELERSEERRVGKECRN